MSSALAASSISDGGFGAKTKIQLCFQNWFAF